jgi:cell division protease FtsH
VNAKRFFSLNKILIAGAILLFILGLWLSFGAGQIVGAKLEAQRGIAAGSKSLQDILPLMVGNGKNGQLIIGEQKTIYLDALGNNYYLFDFKEKIIQDQLDQLSKAGVPVEGKVTVAVEPKRMASTQLAAASYMETAGKAALGILQVALAFLLVFFGVKLISQGEVLGKRFHRPKKEEQLNRFDDVAGHSGPKQEVLEVIEYLKYPERFERTGARVPTGILLYGPPGNGKTLLAKAIAGEANAEFLEQNASSFMQLYVGAGAMAVRALFKEGRKKRPCVIFIDEIDSVGGRRGGGSGGGYDERLQTLNALLAELDGFQSNKGLVVIAATNQLDDLDEALTRPGRFDRKVMVGRPGRADRVEILNVHAKRIPNLQVDLEKWALQTQGFSGADLANLVNEAAIEAARRNSEIVNESDFILARDRVLMGPKNYGHKLNDAENKIIAYHEAGHAVIRTIKGTGRVNKVSILPRGKSLGVTIAEFVEDELLHTRERIHEELLVLMGGRAAEEVFCGRVTNGAVNDMERASQLAREAMKKYGFGEMGPYIPEHKDLFAEIERDAAKWLNSVYCEAVELLKQHQAAMQAIVAQLLVHEEIEGAVVEQALKDPLTSDAKAA